MLIVVVTSIACAVREVAEHLATELGLAPQLVERAMLGGLPAIVLGTADEKVARRLFDLLVAQRCGVLLLDGAEVTPATPADRVRTPRIEGDELVDEKGRRMRLEDVVGILMARRRDRVDAEYAKPDQRRGAVSPLSPFESLDHNLVSVRASRDEETPVALVLSRRLVDSPWLVEGTQIAQSIQLALCDRLVGLEVLELSPPSDIAESIARRATAYKADALAVAAHALRVSLVHPGGSGFDAQRQRAAAAAEERGRALAEARSALARSPALLVPPGEDQVAPAVVVPPSVAAVPQLASVPWRERVEIPVWLPSGIGVVLALLVSASRLWGFLSPGVGLWIVEYFFFTLLCAYLLLFGGAARIARRVESSFTGSVYTQALWVLSLVAYLGGTALFVVGLVDPSSRVILQRSAVRLHDRGSPLPVR